MSLHLVEPIVYAQVDASSVNTLITELKDKLVLAGWTSTSTKAKVVLTFTGVPANNQTCAFDGVTYTFKTALTPAANEVLIGVDATACAVNLAHAINDDTGEGTLYGTGTVVHPTLEAVVSGAAVTIQYKTAGLSGNGFAASESLSNAALNITAAAGVGRYGGFLLTSGLTPHGLQMKLAIRGAYSTTGNRYVTELVVMDMSETTTSTINTSQPVGLTDAATRLLEVVACKYEVHIFLLSSSTTAGATFECGVPYLHPVHVAPVISAVSNNGGLFQIQTATAHGRVTGEHVYINGATASGSPFTALNGDWQITVIDANNYTLDASTYSTGYDASSGRAAGARQISRAIWMHGVPWNLLRGSLRSQLGAVGEGCFFCVNQYSYVPVSTTNTISQIPAIRTTLQGGSTDPPKAFGGYGLFLEPQIGWPVTSEGSEFFLVGDLWNSVLIGDDVQMDKVRNNWNGHNWIILTNDYVGGALALATAKLP